MIIMRVRQCHSANRSVRKSLVKEVDEVLGKSANTVAGHEVRGWKLLQLYPTSRRVSNDKSFRGFYDDMRKTGSYTRNHVYVVGDLMDFEVYACRPAISRNLHGALAVAQFPEGLGLCRVQGSPSTLGLEDDIVFNSHLETWFILV